MISPSKYIRRNILFFKMKKEIYVPSYDSLTGRRSRPPEVYIQNYAGDGFTWHDIWDKHKLIGFLITSNKQEESYSLLTIEEAYILPDYRRKGYMLKKAREILYGYCGHVRIPVQRTNIEAISFWQHAMKKIGAKRVSVASTTEYPDKTVHKYFVSSPGSGSY